MRSVSCAARSKSNFGNVTAPLEGSMENSQSIAYFWWLTFIVIVSLPRRDADRGKQHWIAFK